MCSLSSIGRCLILISYINIISKSFSYNMLNLKSKTNHKKSMEGDVEIEINWQRNHMIGE